MKPVIVLCIAAFSLFVTPLNAQSRSASGGKITASDFQLPASPAIDSSSSAVIISDIGKTEFTGNKSAWFSSVYKRVTRIKIIEKKGLELATVKIHLYEKGDSRETVDNIVGTTYNLDNGQVTETKLAKTDLFIDRLDKNRTEERFTMPGAKEGSIIEYSYTIHSDFIFNMPPWEFQNLEYPCLWSEYQVKVPSVLGYVFNRNGVHPFFIDKSTDGHETYMLTKVRDGNLASGQDQTFSVSALTVNRRWVMKDVPAFYVENFLSSPYNYLDKISFQLHQTNNGETATDVANTWKKATEELLKNEDFGLFMSPDADNSWLDKPLQEATRPNTSDLEEARDIYYYVANHFTCTNYYSVYIKTGLKDVYKRHSGNVGELNLLLTALLRHARIRASPVLLSTREYGFNYPDYPILDRLNYVICRTVIDEQVYYLDASHGQLGFGHLPQNCYNGHARIISQTDSASIYLRSDSIKERKVTFVNIRSDDQKKGVLEGNFQIQLGDIESFKLRQEVEKNGEKKYFDAIRTSSRGDADIVNAWIDSLHQPENPARVQGEFLMKLGDNPDILYFNPFLFAGYRTNPLSAAVRKYPVEMFYPLNETYMLRFEIPEGYEVEEMPKMTKVRYNEGEGSFDYLIQNGEGVIQLRCSLTLKKANFDPEDYNSLRDFFAYVVKKESEQIILRKKK